MLTVMDDEDEGVITAGAVVTVDVDLTRRTLKVSPVRMYKSGKMCIRETDSDQGSARSLLAL